MKKLILSVSLLSVLTSGALSAKGYDNNVNNHNTQQVTSESSAEYSEEQLAQMLAPIALYPDSLLTHILIASTYPIEVVEAERWISQNDKLSASRIAEKLDDKSWEPSVKALVMFPDVLNRLSNDLSWTQQLGDAFLQNEENVLQVIQNLRYQAKKAGSLDKMDNVIVKQEDNNIIIQPVKKEVVYVPYYDSRHVYGHWHSLLYPPIFWDWGHRVRYSRHNPFGWHAGIHISWNYFFSGFHWSNRHVVVINHKNTRRYSPKKHIVRSGYAKRWVHKPQHRKGVRYKSHKVKSRYNSHKPSPHTKVIVRNNKAHKVNNGYKGNKHQSTKHKLKETKVNSQHKYKNKAQRQTDKKSTVQRTAVKQNKQFNSKKQAQQRTVTVNKKTERTVTYKSKSTKQANQVKRERGFQKNSNRAQRSEVRRTSHKGNNQGQRQARRVERN